MVRAEAFWLTPAQETNAMAEMAAMSALPHEGRLASAAITTEIPRTVGCSEKPLRSDCWMLRETTPIIALSLLI
nr:hypothetical protein Itr_chr04CG12450 [Ipomoea trifida]